MKRLLSVFALSAVLFVAGCDDEKKQEVVVVEIKYDFSTAKKFADSITLQGRKEINPKSTAQKKESFSAAQTKAIVFEYSLAMIKENQSDYNRAINGLSGEAQASASMKFLEQYIQAKSIAEMQAYVGE